MYDVSDEVLTALDACAQRLGLTRGEYVRHQLISDERTSSRPVTVRDLRQFAQQTVDLCEQRAADCAWPTGCVGLRDLASCLHYVSMPNVLVRDLPEPIHAVLQERAAARGLSLQQYLSGELRRLAERPAMDEVLARIERRSGGRIGFAQAVEDLAHERR
ncbi:FitA-like ribbon-helix-helix domain-containing protein [Jatrophihabitans lederbergiae]|uniref:Antitoxin FitA-like ribbon-helix-helix domain-containing protein n=1 Tax=Jatrophihabitans lederbergiae TaxID=3075547 RepID=A0ABU2J6H8_9ACTN|nr:hypothetical protein [Jatrophihabitans sp. DSM 44399]MDT0260346.1 hypothetical protein [Jatrophihabitans sp. DSM 44399]